MIRERWNPVCTPNSVPNIRSFSRTFPGDRERAKWHDKQTLASRLALTTLRTTIYKQWWPIPASLVSRKIHSIFSLVKSQCKSHIARCNSYFSRAMVSNPSDRILSHVVPFHSSTVLWRYLLFSWRRQTVDCVRYRINNIVRNIGIRLVTYDLVKSNGVEEGEDTDTGFVEKYRIFAMQNAIFL